MIITDINNITYYSDTMGGYIKKASDYLHSLSLENLEDGKYEIQGDDIYYMVKSYNTKKAEDGEYESHRDYIDIHFMISGEETIYCNSTSSMEKNGDFQTEKDKQSYKDQPGDTVIHMKPEDMAVFYPHDAHKVSCNAGEQSSAAKKIVVKVKI